MIPIRFYIGTSDTSHENADKNSEYTGEFSLNTSTLRFTATAKITLYPSQTYYLWLFPGSSLYGWYYWDNTSLSSMTASGAVGLVYIDNGTDFDAHEVYIDNGVEWEHHIPYIDNGTGWDICV